MRIPLAIDIKTRTGAPDKDARLKNAYVEGRGDPQSPDYQTVVRKRPAAQGGIAVGTGIAQGGIGFTINNKSYVISLFGDVPYQKYKWIPQRWSQYFWYVANDEVVFNDVYYWCIIPNINSPPPNANWTTTAPAQFDTTWNQGTTYATGDHVTMFFGDYWAIDANTGSQPPSAHWSNNFIPAVPWQPTYATLNPSDKHAAITLSNGNLTASGTTGTGIVRSTIGKSSGKWYWEVTRTFAVEDGTGDNSDFGINTPPTDGLNGPVWNGDTGYSYVFSNGKKGHAGIRSAYDGGGAVPQGGTIGVALDMTAGTITFYRNGASLGVAYSGITGTVYAAFAPRLDTHTVNFGASAFAYSVPSGYNSGLYI